MPDASARPVSHHLAGLSRALVSAEPLLLVAITPGLIFAGRLFWPLVGVVVLLAAARWHQTGRLARPAPTGLLMVILLLLLPMTYAVNVTPDLTRASLGYLVAGIAFYQ